MAYGRMCFYFNLYQHICHPLVISQSSLKSEVTMPKPKKRELSSGMEESAAPELGTHPSRQRAVKSWERQGKSLEYIDARLDSIPKEDYYESTLSEHGVRQPKEFAFCKSRLYQPIIGNTKKFRESRGLTKKQNCKDGMDIEELASTDFAKVLSAKRINQLKADSATTCANISYHTAKQVASLLKYPAF